MIRCHRLLGALCGESRTQGFEVEVRAVIRHIDYNKAEKYGRDFRVISRP
ncbi:MAG: hypothetical protein F6K39_19990 [Okeania sp. SIO3B3]|nr:hypothetical protein [Okeania sp. SIO3B3]